MRPIVRKVRDGVEGLKSLLGRGEWSAEPGRKRLGDQSRSWSLPSVVDLQKSKWTDLERITSHPGACLAINHEGGRESWGRDLWANNLVLCFAYAFSTAALGKKKVSWLDYGGGLGQYHLFAKALFPGVSQAYSCLDFPALANLGQQLNPKGRYYADRDQALSKKRYDLIFAGSSLCYEDDWKQALRLLTRCSRGYLYVGGLLFVVKAPTFIVRHKPRQGYANVYHMLVFNWDEFLGAAKDCGLKLVRDMYSGPGPYVRRAPEWTEGHELLFKVEKS
jgi:hypothetical protein